MLEPRKLKVECFRATLTEENGTLTLDIQRQIVRKTEKSRAAYNENLQMIAVPELRENTMYLLGSYREIPESEKSLSTQRYLDYLPEQKCNLAEAAKWIKQLVEKGYYGYGKQYRRNN